MKAIQRQPYKLKNLILIIFLCLIVGHLVIKTIFPNPLFWIIGFIILIGILSFILIKRKDEFGFITIIFICSHISYADNQGGLWNILSLSLLCIYFLIVKKRTKFLFIAPPFMNFLILILILWNFIGLFLNSPMPLINKIYGSLAFLSYIFIYFFVSNQILTPQKLKHFIILFTFITIYMFLAGLNQRYGLIYTNSPLASLVKDRIGYASTHAYGTIGSSALFGEYSILSLALFIPVLVSKQLHINLKLKRIFLIILLIFSFFNILLSGSRAPFLLSIIIFILYIFFILFKTEIKISSLKYIQFIFILVFLVILVGAFIGLDTIFERLNKIDIHNISTNTLISGESINRELNFEVALKRLSESSWIIGYGYGTYESNAIAWYGSFDETFKDTHNLYFALPMIYGWTGAVAFILLFIITIIKLFLLFIRKSNKTNYLRPFLLGLLIFWIIFLINEYKVNTIYLLNYHMIIWIWLGLSNALIKTIKTNRISFSQNSQK